MDPLTEQILYEDENLKKVVNTFKSILNNSIAAIQGGNVNRMKQISKKFKKREIRFIEKDAANLYPDFEKKYIEAKRKVPKSKITPYPALYKYVALGTAMTAAALDKNVDDVMKKVTPKLQRINFKRHDGIGAGLLNSVSFTTLFILLLIAIIIHAAATFDFTVFAAHSPLIKLLMLLYQLAKNGMDKLEALEQARHNMTPEELNSLGIDPSFFDHFMSWEIN